MQTMKWIRIHGLEWSSLILLLWTTRMQGLADFSNYLSRIITSQHALACDGQPLRLHCPRHSTISVHSAFYGSGDDDARLCGSGSAEAANSSCSALTTLQKLMSVCQSQRQCSLPVTPLLFGRDPCPGTRKYLTVVYKCKPTEHKRLVVCEGERLRLRCKPPRVLTIYAAVYGGGPAPAADTCPPQLTANTTSPPQFAPPVDVVSPVPEGIGLPMYPGAMMSNSLITYAYIREHPEMAALLFTCSVCVGLLLTLLAVSIRVSCRPGPIRCLARARSHAHHRRVEEKDEADDDGVDDDDDEEEEDGTSSSLISTKDRKSFKDWEEVTFVCEAAERAERMERREMVMQEIWMNSYMNGAPDV
ncbi:protein eva-1 homolog C isoform X3 [Gadus morhua]|uniref:protein eva-1 homolog C isoform X3 n=1 Tax=Gadus morhua TaxID=8049 RepID=UPI0011B65FDE|nr:protein eva-1 homolog C isoform X3 [Gadus morhua]